MNCIAPLHLLITLAAFAVSGLSVAQDVRDDPRGRFGERYDLKKYAECKKKNPSSSRCEIYRLKRKESPETWPYHSTSPMKWPDPPKVQVYRPGMSPVEYWRALCKSEGGEFISRTVENVQGFYVIRPRPSEDEYAFGDRWVMEDPYGYMYSERGTLGGMPWIFTGPELISRKTPGLYRYLESPILPNDVGLGSIKYYPSWVFESPPLDKRFARFSGYNRQSRLTASVEYTNSLTSGYGITWRGIRRSNDRKSGVAGGELAVVDLRTGEILGLRRGFVLGQIRQEGPVGWGGGNVCPEYALMPGIGAIRRRNKDFDFTLWFVNKVLIPRVQYKD